jgi:hypothetical protein
VTSRVLSDSINSVREAHRRVFKAVALKRPQEAGLADKDFEDALSVLEGELERLRETLRLARELIEMLEPIDRDLWPSQERAAEALRAALSAGSGSATGEETTDG